MSKLEFQTLSCMCGGGWNQWHHPYTHCSAWCSNYKNEPEEARRKNAEYGARGGYYAIGYPPDGIGAIEDAQRAEPAAMLVESEQK